MPGLSVTRKSIRLNPDPSRVITRPFIGFFASARIRRILDRIMALTDVQARRELDRVIDGYQERHRDFRGILARSYAEVRRHVPAFHTEDEERQLLIGSYFTMEYAIESAALFNPSIVPAPDQTGLQPGELRAVLSLRATGEGHVSSIEFREAVVDRDGGVTIVPVSRHVASATVHPEAAYDKELFALKLWEVSVPRDPDRAGLDDFLGDSAWISRVMDRLPKEFTYNQLCDAIACVSEDHPDEPGGEKAFHRMMWLACSNYTLRFENDSEVSERVIFPVTENEVGGIEDARFVSFVDDDGSQTYYATYTAFDRATTLSQLLATRDFREFTTSTLSGPYSQSKGMALFPRRIGGTYAMIGRVDGENLFVMRSDSLHFWHAADQLRAPVAPWELMLIGNCGSPIETKAGWVLLTHGVGPMRRYCIGVLLLDLEDPAKVIGHLSEPLIVPAEDEREGYVPNVVYSCGGLVHGDQLVIPYAVSDQAARVATVSLSALLAALTA
ncbi:MAG: glycosidase [bacterium]|nr:glycosidase [bacterium]